MFLAAMGRPSTGSTTWFSQRARPNWLRLDVGKEQLARVEHDGDGEAFYVAACAMGLEGVVSKRRDAPYLQMRSWTWLKVKWSGWKSHGEDWK